MSRGGRKNEIWIPVEVAAVVLINSAGYDQPCSVLHQWSDVRVRPFKQTLYWTLMFIKLHSGLRLNANSIETQSFEFNETKRNFLNQFLFVLIAT